MSRFDETELIRSLEEARNYLIFSAEKSEFCDSQYYLAVCNFLNQAIKEMKEQVKPVGVKNKGENISE